MQPAVRHEDLPSDALGSSEHRSEERSAGLSLLMVGTSFRNSPISFRESLFRSFSDRRVRELIHRLPYAKESVLLTTCNRIEAYFATGAVSSTKVAFFNLVGRLVTFRPDYFYSHEGTDAIIHLFSVSSGIDSMILGEEQIIDQVSDTGVSERIAGHSKAVLSALFDASCNAGNRVRSLSRGATDSSVSAFALRLALKKLGHRPNSTVLIGTGKTVRLAAKKLAGSPVHVVTSRDSLPPDLRGAERVGHNQLRRLVSESELVIAATRRTGYLLVKDDFSDAKRTVVLDLAFPRNVDPSVRELKAVSLYDLDALAREAAGRPGDVNHATAGARRRIAKEAAAFERRLLASRLSAQLPTLYRWGETVREEELRAALQKLGDLSRRERQVVEVMSRRLVSKILSRPTRFVKNPDAGVPQGEKLSLVEKVFLLGEQDED